MQSMIYVLTQQLKDSKEQITLLQEENTKLQQSPSKRQPSPAKHQQSPSKHSPHKNMIQENWTSNSSEQVTIKKENNDDQEMMETDQLETCNDQEMLMNHNPLSNQTSSSNQDSPKSRGLVRDYDSSEELSRDWSSPDHRTQESKDSLYGIAKTNNKDLNKTPEFDRFSDKDCSNEILRNGVGRTPIKKETLGQV
jgi:hypothetical protein